VALILAARKHCCENRVQKDEKTAASLKLTSGRRVP
jgi:hypothetical protein